MKKIINHSVFFLLAFVCFLTGCTDKNELNTNITSVTNFFSPADNLFVKLQPASNASVTFEWERARAEDGTLVLYEVAFDKENGDFSTPVYIMPSNSNGMENRLSISHGDLNRIANMAGIKSLEQGKMKWTVVASKGINAVRASTYRTLEVERPAGFANIPADLYLTGSATEAGTDLAQAIQFKQLSSGIFELYTSLKEGTYKVVDRNTGTPASFTIDGQLIRESEAAAASPASTPKAYRLRLDFNNAAATLTEIEAVEVWFAPDGRIIHSLTYQGNGIWKKEDAAIEFKQESWGRDERYKFRFTEKNSAGESRYQYYGSTNSDNSRPTDASPAAYYYMVPVNDSRWDFSYKFRTEADRANVDIVVKFQPGGPYTHEVIVK